jgi:polyhydroxyalkanoate synthesis regulator phasin
MQRSLKRKVVAGGIAALAVAGAGGAVAATQLSPKAESDAVLEDAAKELGVEPDELDDALRTALENRVDEAVKAGRMSQEEGERLKEAIESGDFPMLGVPFFRGHGPGGGPGLGEGHLHIEFRGLDDAADYLGMSEEELREQLADGTTLAEVAKAHDKSVDGLVDALVNATDARLDEAVEEGHLSQEQADELKKGTKERVEDFVNGDMLHFHHRWRGPAPGFGPNGPDQPDAESGTSFWGAAA